ncbi:stage II sporulation protein P [Cytobacillus gottheilii]|uniref:stage II sporulation protein P n=1 Tax=Cytobacillus gottheilii TaxID=859144 RepID=UPI0009BBF2CD|nr:stage II sporulation protein P [Cytobacillus gottheilii]
MQRDKDIFKLMKETYPLEPREEFVESTSNKLKQRARKLNRKKKIKRFPIASASIAICTLALSWFFFYGETNLFTSSLSSLGKEEKPQSIVNHQDPLVFIYHSHNTESFFSEAKTDDANQAFHEDRNISLVGERLRQSLLNKGVNSIHDETDIMGILDEKGLPFSQSYTVSRDPLNAALEKNQSIKMAFDIHRDSAKRIDTTVTLNGKDYPRTAFVVSQSSDFFEDNLEFAELLHSKIEEKYPTLSRGVLIKADTSKQNTYNQDLIEQSVLIEIGGVGNTLEEEYRTVDILAEVIEDILGNEPY